MGNGSERGGLNEDDVYTEVYIYRDQSARAGIQHLNPSDCGARKIGRRKVCFYLQHASSHDTT